ncbi:MAG: hypothetical protein KDC03_12985, partial [Flavobacteriales bacterium]|nr:hypothetical protein [Flavobacteriales bacterium]
SADLAWIPSFKDSTRISQLAFLDASRSILKVSARQGVEAVISGTTLEEEECLAFRQALDRAANPTTECRMPDLPAFQRLYERTCPVRP